MSGERPLLNRTPYTGSKMALIGLTLRTLAAEVGPCGVAVNSLSPAPTACGCSVAWFSATKARHRVSSVDSSTFCEPGTVTGTAPAAGNNGAIGTSVTMTVDGSATDVTPRRTCGGPITPTAPPPPSRSRRTARPWPRRGRAPRTAAGP
ncbi:hypothetical protein AB0L59_19205 [Streptomyces sp. NPDC052109]|uniref:hypothetical protein n=1 Tax=Streptomyces sp. NPDC052109 TaxID=3155527 RepID=UPI00343BD12A